MAVTILSSTTTTSQSIGANDLLIVARKGAIYNGAANTILDTGNYADLVVDGEVVAEVNAVYFNNQDGNGNGYHDITVGKSGSITSGTSGAVAVYGDFNTVSNFGQIISAKGTAVYMEDNGQDFVNSGLVSGASGLLMHSVGENTSPTAMNSGMIFGRNAAVTLNGLSPHLTNTGEIRGELGATVRMIASDGAEVVNSGLISGPSTVVELDSQNDKLVNSGTIIGNVDMGDGHDIFDGRGGKVIGLVRGGEGNDTFIVDNTRATLTENGGQGTDTVIAGISYELGTNFEILTLIGSSNLNGSGNGGANVLTGNTGDNRLRGQEGDDVLHGLRGDDRLHGQDGADTAYGGNGDDILRGGAGADLLVGDKGDDTLRGGAGNDRLQGMNEDDTLIGGGGKDTLLGGKGDDTLTGGADLDRFVFANGFGRDTITDFNARADGEDISLVAVSSINNWNDLRTNHMSQRGDHVLINAGGGDTILLKDVLLSDLNPADFLF